MSATLPDNLDDLLPLGWDLVPEEPPIQIADEADASAWLEFGAPAVGWWGLSIYEVKPTVFKIPTDTGEDWIEAHRWHILWLAETDDAGGIAPMKQTPLGWLSPTFGFVEILDTYEPVYDVHQAGYTDEGNGDEPPADEPPADEPPADEPPAQDILSTGPATESGPGWGLIIALALIVALSERA